MIASESGYGVIMNKKKIDKINKFFRQNPFFWVAVFFVILSIIFHIIGIEKTAVGYIVSSIPFLIFIIWLVYFPINFFLLKTKKNKNGDLNNKKKVGWGSFIAYLFIILFIVGSCSIGTYMAKFNQEIIKENK